MDLDRLDHLARSLATASSRRRLLHVLAAVPVVGGLLDILSPEETAAKDRRRRRKQRHNKRKNPGKDKQGKRKKKPQCKPDSVAQTCAGKCGSVTNNCQQPVDCGSCDCPEPCGACLTCQSGPNTTGTCVPDAAQDGDACDDGPLCTTGSVCNAGVCGGGTPVVCPATDCQIPGTCDPATGTCPDPGQQPAGTACASQPCGACDGAGVCVQDAACSGATSVCDGGTCAACTADPAACPDATCCDADAGTCVVSCPTSDPICKENVCAACTSHEECGSNALCVEGVCQTCNVVNGGNLAAAIRGDQNGKPLYVCAGTYAGDILINSGITLIGAGQGPTGTIIQGGATVLRIQAGTDSQPVTLRELRLQNGGIGVFISPGRHLTMFDCTVSDNRGTVDGAGISNRGGTLRMTGCTIENNTSLDRNGGGLFNNSGPATLTDCLFQDNEANFGGGIYSMNGAGVPGATVTLDGTLVTGNTARAGGSNGSGIYNEGNGGSTVTLRDGSVVCANTPTLNQCVNVTNSGGGGCPDTCQAD